MSFTEAPGMAGLPYFQEALRISRKNQQEPQTLINQGLAALLPQNHCQRWDYNRREVVPASRRRCVASRYARAHLHASMRCTRSHRESLGRLTKSSPDCSAWTRPCSRNPATRIRKSARSLRVACLFCSCVWPRAMPVCTCMQACGAYGRTARAFSA